MATTPKLVFYDRAGGPLFVSVEVGIGPVGASYDLRLWDETHTKFMRLTQGSLATGAMQPFKLPEPVADLDELIVECVGAVGPKPAAGTRMLVKIRQDVATIGEHGAASAGGEFVFEPVIGVRLRGRS